MNILKDIESKLFGQRLSKLILNLSILPLSLAIIAILFQFFSSPEYLFLNIFEVFFSNIFIAINVCLYFVLFFISDFLKEEDLKISQLLFYIEHNPTKYNKECKQLLFKQKIPDLLAHIELIETTLKEKYWFLINKDKYRTKILDYLINVDFLKYLSTLDYETIEKYLKDEIDLMKFDKSEEYSNFFIVVHSIKSNYIPYKNQ